MHYRRKLGLTLLSGALLLAVNAAVTLWTATPPAAPPERFASRAPEAQTAQAGPRLCECQQTGALLPC